MRTRPGVTALLGLLLLTSACTAPVVVQRTACDTVVAANGAAIGHVSLTLDVSRPSGGGSSGPGGGAAGSDTGGGDAPANPEVPSSGTHVYLADMGAHPLPGLPTGTTDAQGRAHLPDVPADIPYVVLAPTRSAAGGQLTLKTLIKPHGDAFPPVPVNLATTLVTEAVTGGLRGQLVDLDAAVFERAVAAMALRLRTHRAPDLANRVAVIAWLDDLYTLDPTLRDLVLTLRAAARADVPSPAPSPSPAATDAPSPSPSVAVAEPSPVASPGHGPSGAGVSVTTLTNPFGAPFSFDAPDALAVEADGDLLVAHHSGVTRVSGGSFQTVLPRIACVGVAVDASGTVYASESDHVLDMITPVGILTVIGQAATAGRVDGVGSASAFHPWGLVVDGAGNLIVADYSNHCIRKRTPDGVFHNLAGTGDPGHQDGSADQAQFSAPMFLAIDRTNTLYVTDNGTGYVRTISPDGQVGTLCQVPQATGIAVDAAGTVYVASALNQIYRLAPGGSLEVIAGGDGAGGLVDNGQATAERLNNPLGLAVGRDGALYVADSWNNRVRKVQ